ncbi:MAG: putative C-S lyase [Methylobacterium mesophilicum]|nr:putative C-S lyase [Methylobacterium mesophilicum]
MEDVLPPKVSSSSFEGAKFDFNQVPDRRGLSTLKWELEIERAGDQSILSFGTAEMDFLSPPAVVEALKQTADAGHFGYPLRRDSYFDAVTAYLDRQFDWHVERSWIQSGVGIYTSMHPVIAELTEPGDEIIFQPPVHHVFAEIITANGRRAIANPLVMRAGQYGMDLAGLEAALTARTKMLLLCSPHNPVGRVWTRGELTELAGLCADRGIIVVADEVYCGLLYEGVRFTPFAMVSPWAAMNSFSMISPSKPFNLTGLKHSIVIAANQLLRDAYARGLSRTNLSYGGSIFGQAAAEAAFRDSDRWSLELMRYIARNHAYVANLIRTLLPEVSVTLAEATYFAWLDLRGLNVPQAKCRDLLEKDARLVVTYGEPMGTGGEGHIRLNLATPRTILQQGMRRLLAALVPLTGRRFDQAVV